MYSQVIDDFILAQPGDDGTIYSDPSGNTYTVGEAEQKLPLLSHRQLYADGTMPDSLKGVALDHETISTHRASYMFNPRNFQTPSPLLWPLLESKSGRASLSLPEDFFRLDESIEFIVAETNQVDREKSKVFNQALLREGFVFPAGLVAGIPTARKSRDDGYFITDNTGALFHLKMVQGEPYVSPIETPDEMDVIFIECVDMSSRELFAYVYTASNNVFMLLQEDYRLQQLPISEFDFRADRLRIRHDLFGKTISHIKEDQLFVKRINKSYEQIDQYETSWSARHERPDYRMFSYLFPFELRLEKPESEYVGFFLQFTSGYYWGIFHILLLGLTVWLIKRKKQPVRKHIPDLALVLLTGLFGFIAVRVFPNRFYD